MLNKIVCFLCILSFFIICFPNQIHSENKLFSSNDWTTFRHDMNRTGYTTSDAPDFACLGWGKKIPGAGEFWSSPSILGDTIYIGNSNGNLYCLDSLNGDVIWTFLAGPYAVYSSPTIAYNNVYFGGPEREIFALPCDDPDSSGIIDINEIEWNYTVGPSNGGANDIVCGSPAVKDGKLFLGAIDQFFYCLNATERGVKYPIWKTYTPFWGQHAFSSSPALYNGKIFSGTGNQPGQISSGRLYCFNESTGHITWEFDLHDITYSTPVIYNGNVYISNSGDWIVGAGNKTYKLYCLDIDGFLDGVDDGVADSHYGNSDLIWSYNTGGYVYSSPAVHNGMIFFGCHNGNITCLNADTGKIIWICQTHPGNNSEPGGIMGSPAIADEKIFIGTQDGKLLAISEKDSNSDGIGEILWSYNIGGKVVCSPVVANNAVYIGNQYGMIYCFRTPTIPESYFILINTIILIAIVVKSVSINRNEN